MPSTRVPVISRRNLAVAVLVLTLVSCEGAAPELVAVRLIDRFQESAVDGSIEPAPIEPTEWRFDGSRTVAVGQAVEDDTGCADAIDKEAVERCTERFGWGAFHGIHGIQVRDGRLVGTAENLPLIHAAWPAGLDSDESLYALSITMRVSEGTRLGVTLSRAQRLDEQVLRTIRTAREPALHAELEPGDRFRTYTVRNTGPPISMAEIRDVLIQPTDAEGAEFAIESIRLLSHAEHLRSIASGPAWRGLGGVYRETIVGRSPEHVAFDLDLPSRPWLDLAVGTIGDAPVTFSVSVEQETVWRRTVSRPDRWESTRVDLQAHAGRRVSLSLGLEGDEGSLGFWGTPVVRNSGARPRRAASTNSDARRSLPDAATETPRGVIVFLADTLRRDHLDSYGYGRETAPTLSRIASEGARFADAISPGTWTSVVVSSVLSSTYPASNGIVDFVDPLPGSATTLAEAFRGAGYATFHTSSVVLTGRLNNLHQGVEVLHERASIGDLAHSGAKTARTYVDRFLTWLDEHHDVPFFAFIHVFDPHAPYEPYTPYDSFWAAPGGRELHEARLQAIRTAFGDRLREGDGSRPGARLYPNREELERADIDPDDHAAHQVDWYDGSIRAMDAEVGRLFEELERRGLADDTLFAFFSDHGEEFLDHGWPWHGNTVYGEIINVPLMLRWPGVIPSGLVVDQTVESVGLMPTLLELSGIAVPDQVQGQSMVPLLAASADARALGWRDLPVVSERKRIPSSEPRKPYDVDQYTLIKGGWKLVQNVDPPQWMPEYELYDHLTDPIDQRDIADRHPEVVELLQAELIRRLRQLRSRPLLSDYDAATAGDAELTRHLRSLGYIR